MAPGHSLSQCWFEIIGIHPSTISQENVQDRLANSIKFSMICMHLPGDNELKCIFSKVWIITQRKPPRWGVKESISSVPPIF